MELVELADALKALAAPSRLKIMELLQARPYCVRALTLRLAISQPAVSQHLAVLKRAGLVEADRKGTMVHYRVNPQRFERVVKALGVVGHVRLRETAKVAPQSFEWGMHRSRGGDARAARKVGGRTREAAKGEET